MEERQRKLQRACESICEDCVVNTSVMVENANRIEKNMIFLYLKSTILRERKLIFGQALEGHFVKIVRLNTRSQETEDGDITDHVTFIQ